MSVGSANAPRSSKLRADARARIAQSRPRARCRERTLCAARAIREKSARFDRHSGVWTKASLASNGTSFASSRSDPRRRKPMSQRSLLEPIPRLRPAQRRPALLAKGFRPFFLLATSYAFVAVPVWTLMFAGKLGGTAYLGPTYWHAHEMVFGFAVAVIAGFLLTAVGNWTGRETATGLPLALLALLWVLGRIAVLFGDALKAP